MAETHGSPKSKSIRSKCEEVWAALSPEERARIEASWAEISGILAQSGAYQKGLLRRLGVRTNVDDFEEHMLQLQAATRFVGISKEEFLEMTPREVCAVLEHRAWELALLKRGQDIKFLDHGRELAPPSPGDRRSEPADVLEPLEPGTQDELIAAVRTHFGAKGKRPYVQFYRRLNVSASEFSAWLRLDAKHCGRKKRQYLNEEAAKLLKI